MSGGFWQDQPETEGIGDPVLSLPKGFVGKGVSVPMDPVHDGRKGLWLRARDSCQV